MAGMRDQVATVDTESHEILVSVSTPVVDVAVEHPSVVVEVTGPPGPPGTGGGGGTDEVWIGDTEPVDPALELWYDTSAASTIAQGPPGPPGPPGAQGPAGADGSDGTAILSGTATPTAAVGVLGDYYLDTDGHILYGPRASENYGPSQSVWTSQVPNGALSFGGWSLGSDFTFAVAGRITALRWYKGATSPDTAYTLRVWNTTNQAQLGNASTGSVSGTGWKIATLSTPVVVAAGQRVRVALDMPTGGGQDTYTPTDNITTGDITMSGSFQGGSPGEYPTGTSTRYWMVDVVFEKAPDPWPVAVYGVPPGGTTGQVLKKTSNSDYAVGWVT